MERNKKSKEAAKAQTERNGTQITSLAQLSHRALRRPFELMPSCDFPIWLPFFHNNWWHLMALIEALKNNTSVPKLSLRKFGWKKRELAALEDSLSHNCGIKELEFHEFDLDNSLSYKEPFGFTPDFMETLVRILKRNWAIKKITFKNSPITVAAWARFCDGLEYYHIEELSIISSYFKVEHITALCEGITTNQTIRSLSFKNEILPGRSAEYIYNMMLYQPWIEKLDFSGTDVNFPALSKVIHANHLKVLGLRHCGIDEHRMQVISKSLQDNTSITELNLKSTVMDFRELGNILQKNKTIKKLNLNGANPIPEEGSLGDLDFKNNKTITDLSIVNACWDVSLPTLLRHLEENTTIRKLKIGYNVNVQQSAIEHFFRNNKTLREFNLAGQSQTEDLQKYAMALSKALRVNNTLQKLSVPFSGLSIEGIKPFFEALENNMSLTYLDFSNRKNTAINDALNKMSEHVLDCMIELLKKNKTLRHIQGAEELVGLQRNREEQDMIISNACTLIKMILRKPNSFILPIEVWSDIFKYISYSFVLFDFEKFFNESMARS